MASTAGFGGMGYQGVDLRSPTPYFPGGTGGVVVRWENGQPVYGAPYGPSNPAPDNLSARDDLARTQAGELANERTRAEIEAERRRLELEAERQRYEQDHL